MIWGFADPWQYWWGFSLLALLAIYLWWRKSTLCQVSAIFLWDYPLASPQSGRRFKVTELPLSFYLEALVLLALVLALAAPYWVRKSELPPLAVILDNSFSMQQKLSNNGSARGAALAKLMEILATTPQRRILYFTAGRTTRLLYDGSEKFGVEQNWHANEGESNLAQAVAQVRNLGEKCDILVLSDHGDAADFASDVDFYSFGEDNANVALVNARLNEEKLLLEVENFSVISQSVKLTLSGGHSGADNFTLAPGERRKLIYQIKRITSPLQVELTAENDALAVDNVLTLLPENKSPVKYAFSAELSPEMRQALRLVLENNPDYAPAAAGEEVELFFSTSRVETAKSNFIWLPLTPEAGVMTAERLQSSLVSEIVTGVGIDDLHLAVDPAARLPGRVLLRRGNELILSMVKRGDDKYDFYLNMEPTRSNFAGTAAWPVLFYNIAEALRQVRPGVNSANWRLGEVIEFRSGNNSNAVEQILRLHLPTGATRAIKFTRQRAFVADLPGGITKIIDGKNEYLVAVQNCSGAESDLSVAKKIFKAAERKQAGLMHYQKSLVFAAILLALGILLWHNQALGRRRGEIK